MNGVIDFLLGLDLAPLYTIIDQLAKIVASTVSPLLLVIAIYTRTMETQLDGLVSGGRWAAAIRDMVGWGVVLGLYAMIGSYIIDLMNAIYAWGESIGSLDMLMKSYSDIMKKWSDRLNMDDLSLASLVSTPVVMFTGLAYYMTLILATFVALFFKVANVLVYGVAYIWGLIAIPMSISTTFSILRGWGLLMGLALLWPFVTSLFLAIFASLFANAAGIVAEDTTLNAAIALSNIYLLFSVLHLLLIAVLVASPFVAQALVANVPAAAGIVTPFVGAALAAGAVTAKAGEKAGGSIASRVGGFFGASTKPAASNPQPRASLNRPTAADGAQSFSNKASEGVDSGATPATPAPAQPGPGDVPSKSRRAQRNAIIRQNLKKRGP